MLSRGYTDSLADIRYEKTSFLNNNNQGYYTVYTKLGGVESYCVTVNVKTGDFHG